MKVKVVPGALVVVVVSWLALTCHAETSKEGEDEQQLPPWVGKRATCVGEGCGRPSTSLEEATSRRVAEEISSPQFPPRRRKLESFVDEEEILNLVTHDPVKITYEEAQDWNYVKHRLHEQREKTGKHRRVLNAFVPENSSLRRRRQGWFHVPDEKEVEKEAAAREQASSATPAQRRESLLAYTARLFRGGMAA